MEKKIDGKMKSVASIPANYVSILELQERWMKEKERNQTKEEDLVERGVKQQVNGQRRREDIMKVVVGETMEPRVKLEGKDLGGGIRRNDRKKEPKCVEKEELEDGGDSRERTKIWSKKENKNHVEEVVKSESKAYIPRENNPVKEELSKGEKKTDQNRENAAAGDSIAVETQFQELRVEEEGGEAKGPVRLNSKQGYYRNQKHNYWSSTRVPMVWVKKGKHGWNWWWIWRLNSTDKGVPSKGKDM